MQFFLQYASLQEIKYGPLIVNGFGELSKIIGLGFNEFEATLKTPKNCYLEFLDQSNVESVVQKPHIV